MATTTSKQAMAYLIDPTTAPEPSSETGPGAHFGSTIISKTDTRRDSRNPFRSSMTPPPRNRVSGQFSGSPGSNGSGSPRRFGDHREEMSGAADAPPSYDAATSPKGVSAKTSNHHRRTSSLRERFPGDESHKPLDIIRRDSKKAHRSPHLAKRHIPGADTIDKLDPAFGGIPYHHEGPYDAALLARNTSYDSSPLAALKITTEEALKATPSENVKDALDHHVPLDGVAIVPPGVPDRFGRTYNYEEGADLLHESINTEPGYKRWADKDYDSADLKGRGEPSFSLDRALRVHKLDDNGIEMSDRAHLSREYEHANATGTLDTRDPIDIAGGEAKYVELEQRNDRDYTSNINRTSSLRLAGQNLKKRFSLRKQNKDE